MEDFGEVRIRLFKDFMQEEILLVFEKRQLKQNFVKPEGCGLIGGKIQQDETPYQAAVRETLEESGFEADIEAEPIHVYRKKNEFGNYYYISVFNACNPRKASEQISGDVIDLCWYSWKWAGTAPIKYEKDKKEYRFFRGHIVYAHLLTSFSNLELVYCRCPKHCYVSISQEIQETRSDS